MPWRIVLWVAFAVVHLWLVLVNLTGPGYPLGDVQWVYPAWIDAGLSSGQWVGIQLPWVYPLLALVPMLLAHVGGDGAYPVVWLVLVSALDAIAFGLLLGSDGERRRRMAAAFWLVFLVALGPIALGRIDAVAVALAICAVAVLARRPRVGALLLTVGAWVKVWPAALVAAALIAGPRRRPVLLAAAGVSVLVVLVALILGSGTNVLSFVTQQTGRGVQVEAPVATAFLLGAAGGGPWTAYYDTRILTWQVRGPGVAEAGTVTTAVLVVLVLGIALAGGIAARRGADAVELLPGLSLALVLALVVANKVGSPQFVTWLAAPLICGVLLLGPGIRDGFAAPALAALAIAALTQAVYPFFYGDLLALRPPMLVVLALRNLLDLGLLVEATRRVVRLALSPVLVRRPLPEGVPT